MASQMVKLLLLQNINESKTENIYFTKSNCKASVDVKLMNEILWV